ncbi:mitochondrial genome maintenance MGM101 [Eremomyces bilateralis CBS 781.70]|uniref:Mitochondrial genome maintenance protein MGM101 n=1 Tax=Eremomyces bilateralis CBS 781.70 TaxID=1392243 RepID=A0A6G1G9Z0_9PEZI|nr:mitochondrial genome maintenance MGM101 [Eremomyces bilateralis CBS 781.70]KAF1814853.1 mitochondrial genome maintenance MGM101 [Eremomyces bilateralis CBS 781.70]
MSVMSRFGSLIPLGEVSYASTATTTSATRPSPATSTTRPSPTTSTARPSPPAATSSKPLQRSPTSPPHHDMASGLLDAMPGPPPKILPDGQPEAVDWSRSFSGMSTVPFSKESADVLLRPIPPEDIEIKPDGIVYLPEIKYRRILNRAFGPGGWGLAPRGETIVTPKSVNREYGLVVQGRLVSIARGEQQYFDPEGIPTATEGCKSNALMRCCKDLGIASELWDPVFIRGFMSKYSKEVWVEHVATKKKRKIVTKKGVEVKYPYKETSFA